MSGEAAIESRCPTSEFALHTVVDRFGLALIERNGAYASLSPVESISHLLTTLWSEQVPLAVAINTEKARSEMIVVNVLAELRRQLPGEISIFSGVEMDVEKTECLNGYCDFLISRSPQQMMVSAPIVALAEAKNDNLPAAWGQCGAEVIAAQRFTERRGNSITKLYGVVTNGTVWMFGSLEGKTLSVDLQEYGIDEPERICGILIAMVHQTA